MKTLLIHTGGTIGMVATDAGFAPAEGVVEGFLAAHAPDTVDLCLLSPLIDSANATPADWGRIAATIADHYAAYDAFLVTHGTDTLAYTAAALCFALEGLGKPVILTGAMLPLTVEGSDGGQNLLDAIVAAHGAPAGVWVQFAGRLLHGARVRKSHSRALDAFAADPSDIAPRRLGDTLLRHTTGPAKTAFLSVAPGVPTDLFQHAAETCDGLILRCYGSGTVPGTPGLARALATARARDIPVLAVSQCPEGGMVLGTYAAAAILLDHGVIDGRDMTVEAAYAKLAYTLAESHDPATRRAHLERSLCGEFTP
ncbi:asparaginase [Shimia aestuarii]|uniref:asparaginase n=1 Tax=Shimia aestuarii TaxID=254406 RepID=UPI001FB56D74|nr:asparaginase [Shimia aestuarii]